MAPVGIMFTSGTTSRPKAVVHTHANALWASRVGPTNIAMSGDDVYLMNFWPMDNLNLLGGGARYVIDDAVELALSVGMSQPNNPFQQQTDLFPARAGFLREAISQLTPNNAQRQLYLTDVVELAADRGKVVDLQGDMADLTGVNDQRDLALAAATPAATSTVRLPSKSAVGVTARV